MNKIFISYSRKDEIFARRLAADLDRDGVDVWIDVEDIPSGANWSNAINDGLNQAEILILVMSPDSLASKNVEDEWQFFHNQAKPILPVYIAPGGKVHYQLARLQYIEFHLRDYEEAYDDMLAEMQQKGFTIERLANTLARLEEQRRQIEAERDRLKEESEALQRATTERNRIQEELNALQKSEAERQQLSVVIQKLQKEEQKYEQIKEAEAKRATGNEDAKLKPVSAYSSTATFQIPVRLKRTPEAEEVVEPIPSPAPTKRRGLIAGAGLLALIVIIGAFLLFGNKDDAENGRPNATPTEQAEITETPLDQSTSERLTFVEGYVREGDSPITALAWSPDEGILAAGGDDRQTIIAWLEGPQILEPSLNHRVHSVVWSPDEDYIAVMSDPYPLENNQNADGGTPWQTDIWVFSRESDQELAYEFTFDEERCATQSDLLWDDSSAYLVATCNDVIYLFDIRTQETIRAEGEWSNLIDIDFSPDYAYLAGIDDNRELLIWDSPDEDDLYAWQFPEAVADFNGVLKGNTPIALEWSPSSYIALIGGEDEGVVQIWEVQPAEDKGEELITFENATRFSSLAWIESGDNLAVGDVTGTLSLVDVSSQQIETIDVNPDGFALTALSWTELTSQLVAGYEDGYIAIWTP